MGSWQVEARRRTGIACVVYDLRHTFGTRSAMTVPPPTLKTLMGHANIATTMRYIHPSHADIAAAMERLDDRSSPGQFWASQGGENRGTNGKTGRSQSDEANRSKR